jgi:hypothetical protein
MLALATDDRAARPTLWITLSDDAFASQLERMDGGELLATVTVTNIFERDVFSWYLTNLGRNYSLLNSLRLITAEIGLLALPRLVYGATATADVLRDLYHDVLPRPVRKALGEFLTPSWLAEHCLRELESHGADIISGRVLDPTCGTGTFLVPLLRSRIAALRTSGSIGQTQIRDLLDTLCGFDINPVAVTAARTNFVLALGDLASTGQFTLPIWRADSVNVPEDPALQMSALDPELVGLSWKQLKTSLPIGFPVPVELATSTGLSAIRSAIESAISEPENRALHTFELSLDAAIAAAEIALSVEQHGNVMRVARILFTRIQNLHRDRRDGVWARIIENAFAPILVGTFDVVVGNPPWISWTRLPEAWRRATEPIWKRYGLWRIPREGKRRQHSLASGDIATLIYAVSVEKYCRPTGFVGLLTPKHLITADPGARAFRQFHLKPHSQDVAVVAPCDVHFAPVWFEDWSIIKPFSPDAANTPIFLVCQRRSIPGHYPVQGKQWRRKLARRNITVNNLELILEGTDVGGEPVTRTQPLSAWSVRAASATIDLRGGSNDYSFGKGIDTRGANGVYFVELVSSRQDRLIIVRNLPSEGRDRRIPARAQQIDSRLVYPLLRGRDVKRWIGTPSGFIVAPYEQGRLSQILTEEELSHYSGGLEFFRTFRSFLQSRSARPNRGWKMDGDDWYRLDGPVEYMSGAYKVVVRELQDGPSAALIRDVYSKDLGRTATVLVDHKLSFCSMASEEEALYLVGMINCSPMQGLLKTFSNSIAVSPQTLARLPIPKFDQTEHATFTAIVADVIRSVAATHDVHEDEARIDEAALHILDVARCASPGLAATNP